MKKLVAATHNKGKLVEMERILSGFELLSVGEFDGGVEPIEDGETFRENALIKARSAYDCSHLPSFGDDSGLCVDALNGAPGVYSARYAETPKECIKRLLRELEGVSDEQRTARFVCCIAYCDGETEFTVEGNCEGKILFAEDGEGGFGYDPVFYSFDLNKSFGKASMTEKNTVSHRARALDALKEKLGVLKK
ncbi:MAG: RdgB/HAM1 family non-canonical purine NTP pyrophosphatase [Clostridia bacterium]|nr:RdgB/HAM1 family non-canonical purine NTP pyrophosphatase [Clostridia bacterium]